MDTESVVSALVNFTFDQVQEFRLIVELPTE